MDSDSAIWGLKLPIKISLSSANIKQDICKNTSVFYLSLPAISYLPLVVPQVRAHFQPHDTSTQCWFSYQGSPVRWHLAVGVLRDLFRVQADLWEIQINFGSEFPNEIEPLSGSELESSFIMAIKEADQIRTKSQKTNLFQSADYKRLWNSILENDIREWKSVASPLGEQVGDGQNIAAKFHCDQSYFQRPIKAGCSIRAALDQFNLESDRHRILYMGIELDLETDLGDLEKISYPDTFVHLVLQPV